MSHALEITRTFNAPPARIFACFTNQEEWNGWAGSREAPGEITLLEPHVGGRYRMVMRRPDGVEMAVGGVFQVLEEPSRLAFTWKWEHGEETTLITIFLRDVGGKTEMHLRHEGFAGEEDRNNHNRGWTSALERLEAFVARGPRQKSIILEGAAQARR